MKLENNINFIRRHINMYSEDNTILIDATCGNGNDTRYLAEKYPRSRVYAFDIQKQAIDNSVVKCNNLQNIEFINDSHANIDKYISRNVSLAIFNLGYLPRGDVSITTMSSSTIEAIDKILTRLNVGGAIIITLYRGEKNQDETKEVLEYVKLLNKDFFIVSLYDLINLNNNPFNIIIEKK